MNSVAFFLLAVSCFSFWAPHAGADEGDGHGEAGFVAPDDGALVVFVRRRFLKKGNHLFVLDEDERCIAATKGKTHTKVVMEPGRHSVFVFFLKSGRWVELELEAGRTYLIRTRPKGVYGTQLEIYPAVRGEATFAESKEWLANTKPYQADLAGMTRKLQKRKWRRRYAKALAQGDEMLESLADGETRSSLRADDGRTGKEASELRAGE